MIGNRAFWVVLVGCLLPGLVWGLPVVPNLSGERETVAVGEKKPFYLLIEFDVVGEEKVSDESRPPVHLTLVLDRSGSMEGKGKIQYLRQAAKMVVDRLGANDRLAIVEYDDKINVLWPLSPVEAKDMIKRRIDGLTPRGSTNLHGGLMKGVEQAAENVDVEAVNRVLLLSDGLANAGVTDPGDIYRDVRGAKKKGLSITTLGLGLEYNEDLMQGIAENGRGHYYFVENPKQMARIFQEELSALSQTVAKEVKAVFTAGKAVKGVKVYAYEGKENGKRTEISLEDFFAGEKRSLLLRLEVEPEVAGELKMGTLSLSYVDLLGGSETVTVSRELTVTASASPKEVEESVKAPVLAEAMMIDADEQHEHFVRQYEQGEQQAAKENIANLSSQLSAANHLLKDAKLAKKMEALDMEREEMDRVSAAAPDDQKAYLKTQKQRFYEAKRGKRSLYMMQEGDKGVNVEQLQKMLHQEGLYNGPVDGHYSPALSQAVQRYQQRENLSADGVAGPNTLKSLGLY